MTLSSALEGRAAEQARRTGPIGRGARLVLALALGAFVALRLATFAAKGPAGYRDPSILGDPGLWLLTAIVVFGVVDFAGRFAPTRRGSHRHGRLCRAAKHSEPEELVAVLGRSAGANASLW
jgi:hypothetical protein